MIRGPFQTVGQPVITFRALDFSNVLTGIGNLSDSLTINSITVAPSLRYKGGDADASSWNSSGYGANLGIAGAGAAPLFNQGSPCLGASDDSVLFGGGASSQYYIDAGNTDGNVGIDDIVIEFVFKTHATIQNNSVCEKRGTSGWGIVQNGVMKFYFYASGAAGTTATGALSAGTWYHAVLCVDRSGFAQWYLNGVASGTAKDYSAKDGLSLDNTTSFSLGLETLLYSLSNLTIAEFCLWHYPNWLTTDTTNQEAVVRTRFSQYSGTFPQRAIGTSLPLTASRKTSAYLDHIVAGKSKLDLVGPHWLRIVKREDNNSIEMVGLLIESATTNKCLQSENFATTWTLLDVGDSISSDYITAPNGEITGDGLIGDSTDGDHGVTQDITVTAINWVISVFAKKGTHDWLYVSNDTVANCTCYFDLTNGIVGTIGAGVVSAIIDKVQYFGDWWRCGIIFTGTAATHTFKFQAADADGDKSVVGDGAAVMIGLWGAQVESGDHFKSYVPTTTAAVTKTAELLVYKGDDGNIIPENGIVETKILMPVCTISTGASQYIGQLTDGDAATDLAQLLMNSTSNLYGFMRASGGLNGDTVGTSILTDGVIHQVMMYYHKNNLKVGVDGCIDGTPDLTCDVPLNLDRINIGHYMSTSSQLERVISKFTVKK
jgi:hypothetical protein